MRQHRLWLMRADWLKMRILQKINASADRQERSFEIRTSHSRGPLSVSVKDDSTKNKQIDEQKITK